MRGFKDLTEEEKALMKEAYKARFCALSKDEQQELQHYFKDVMTESSKRTIVKYLEEELARQDEVNRLKLRLCGSNQVSTQAMRDSYEKSSRLEQLINKLQGE